jgi:hypothetical protein
LLIQRAVDELLSLECFDLDVETVAAQEDIRGSEGDKKGPAELQTTRLFSGRPSKSPP